ncbi:MAG: FAD-dependent oxidoreductase [Pseudomonadota bacterium]
MPAKAEIVIIGGGAVGLSVAAHLGWRGARDVVLLERHQLTSGTSWHAAGIIGPLRSSMKLTKLSIYAIDLFDRLERDTGVATGYRRTGGLWLAQRPDRMQELRRTADIGLVAGLQARIVGPSEISDAWPLLDLDGIVGGLWVDEDGQADPVGVCMAYAAAARAAGVRIVEHAPVDRVLTRGDRVNGVQMVDGHQIACAQVINCAGAWAGALAAKSGVAVPLHPVEHMYVVAEPVPDLPDPCPIVRDLDARIYVKEDAGRLVLGGFEPDAKLIAPDAPGMDRAFLELPEDWDQFTPFMQAGLKRIPALGHTGIQHFMNGPESFTPDTAQIMGEAPELDGYFVAAGFNSIGIVSSAGAGRVMADWILDGDPPMDLSDVDIARFEPDMATPDFLTARTAEAVASQFDMHWPFKRPKTGRNLRRLPAHDVWTSAGAVFGAPAGWERPMWFGEEVGYSYADQPWRPAAARECLAARDQAVVMDLSPFSKFELTGRNHVQQAFCSDMDIAPGRIVYTFALNDRGGIELEATVTRSSEDTFLMTGAAPSRRRDLRWLTRHVPGIKDVTRQQAVLGLFGPKAGLIWQNLDGPADALAMPFGSRAAWTLNDIPVQATRISYIGEFGWEISCSWGAANTLATRMIEAGAVPMGLHAVEACRIEMGFRHWGHDIGPEETPLEAGLGFTIAWDTEFIGKDALARQQREGPKQCLVQFAVDGDHPLLLHDEPIFRNGALVSRTTSGARGFRTGLSLCFAYLPVPNGETMPDLARQTYEISVAGRRYPLRILAKPAYPLHLAENTTGARGQNPRNPSPGQDQA